MNPALKIAESFGKLQGIKIQSKELVNDWLLITYDLPVDEKGSEARAKFLKLAPRIGAKMHSRSVYLMPNTQQAQLAAVDLSKTLGGCVWIWTGVPFGEKAEEVTKFYDEEIEGDLTHLSERLEKEGELIKEEKFGMADRMHRKTTELFMQTLFAMTQRGSHPDTVKKMVTIYNKLLGPAPENGSK